MTFSCKTSQVFGILLKLTSKALYLNCGITLMQSIDIHRQGHCSLYLEIVYSERSSVKAGCNCSIQEYKTLDLTDELTRFKMAMPIWNCIYLTVSSTNICRATTRPPRPSSTAECLRLIARLREEQASAVSWEPRPPFEAAEMD